LRSNCSGVAVVSKARSLRKDCLHRLSRSTLVDILKLLDYLLSCCLLFSLSDILKGYLGALKKVVYRLQGSGSQSVVVLDHVVSKLIVEDSIDKGTDRLLKNS
jgi:hypothetical protein